LTFKIFGISKFTFSVLFLILLQFICLGIGFLLPNYSQLVMGENALTAGCILLPGCIIGAVLNPFTGKLLDHCGAPLPIFIGTVCALISSLLFAGFITIASTTALSVIYIFLCSCTRFYGWQYYDQRTGKPITSIESRWQCSI
jgi:DHA2 family lincomycin resistance protein-like MFS transporter